MARAGTSAKGAARRAEILDAAREVLAQEGYRNSSLRSIARRLGTEAANILYYFGSREDLLREVIERWDGRVEGRPRSPMTLESYAERIRANLEIPGIVHTYLTFAAEAVDPSHSAHEFFRERFEITTRALADVLRAGQRDGTIRADVDPDRAARMLVAAADGLQLQALFDERVDAPSDLEAAIRDLRV